MSNQILYDVLMQATNKLYENGESRYTDKLPNNLYDIIDEIEGVMEKLMEANEKTKS